MIETVSYPADLSQWDAQSSNFYLELYGETMPFVDLSYAEIIPSGINPDNTKQDVTAQTISSTPIYQYWWTIGQAGNDQALELRKHLKDPAARVYMYFPLSAGWRIKELVATVKYLSSIKEDVDWLSQVSHIWNVGAPVLGGAADIAKFVPVASLASPIFSAIAKIKLNDMPPVDDFAWTVAKVTTVSQGNPLQGVMWTLPIKMFTHIGGRITGSLAVSFISSQRQQPGTVKAVADEPNFEQQPIRAHARIYVDNRATLPPDQDVQQQLLPDAEQILPADSDASEPKQQTISLPSRPEFIELSIRPRKP